MVQIELRPQRESPKTQLSKAFSEFSKTLAGENALEVQPWASFLECITEDELDRKVMYGQGFGQREKNLKTYLADARTVYQEQIYKWEEEYQAIPDNEMKSRHDAYEAIQEKKLLLDLVTDVIQALDALTGLNNA